MRIHRSDFKLEITDVLLKTVQVCGARGLTSQLPPTKSTPTTIDVLKWFTKYASRHELNNFQMCVSLKSMLSRADWHQEFEFFSQQNDVEICKFRNGIQGATLRHTMANICHRRPHFEKSRKRTIEILLIGLT